MPIWTRIGTSALALSLAASAGWSLTADQAWESWKSAAQATGQTLTAASEDKSGNALTLGSVSIVATMDEATFSADIGDVVLTENSDGTVTVTMVESYPVDLVVAPEYGEKLEMTLMITQPGLTMIASDVDGATSYSYDVPSMTLSVTEMTVDGETIPFNMNVTVASMVGAYGIGPSSPPEMSSTYSVASVDMAFDVKDPEGDGTFIANVTMSDLAGTSTGNGGGLMSLQDVPTMLKNGLATQFSTTYGATTFDMSFKEATENFAANGKLDGGALALAISPEQMTYQVSQSGLNVTATGSEIPLPEVTLGLAETAFTFLIPVEQSEGPKPFALGVELRDLTVADGLWNMLDPGTVLPRDPATITLNLAGTLKWLVDIMDEEAMVDTDMPAELYALSISDVLIKAAGASIAAEGSFTFDNTDLITFGGLPAPNGKVNLTLNGANGLLDNLVKMGLVPADDANGIKLMSGAFLRAGSGEDELTSEITVTPDGTVSANGIPIPF